MGKHRFTPYPETERATLAHLEAGILTPNNPEMTGCSTHFLDCSSEADNIRPQKLAIRYVRLALFVPGGLPPLVRNGHMKPAGLVCLSAVIGILAGAGVCLPFLSAFNPCPDPGPDWRDRAAASTMPGRRAYTLPLNNPDMVPVSQASYMQDEDVVLTVLIQGEARAYPWWLTSNYHVVNDTVGDAPLLITLCEVCGGAAAFQPVVPELPGLSLSFQICGISLGTIEIVDHQTLSKWRPFSGTAFEGPLKGRSMENYPLLVMTWKDLKQRYPMALVANGSPQLRLRPHGAEAGSRIGDPELPTPFAATANLTDHRLGTHDLIFGIMIPETGQAYALPVGHLVPFPNLFVVTLDGKPVLVAREGDLAMTAFDLSPTPYRAGFSLVATNPISFRTPDGLIWNAFGVSTPAGRPERKLPPARSYLTEWYEWVSHSPNSEIVDSVKILSATADPETRLP